MSLVATGKARGGRGGEGECRPPATYIYAAAGDISSIVLFSQVIAVSIDSQQGKESLNDIFHQ
mgnify:CR=1 FL=1